MARLLPAPREAAEREPTDSGQTSGKAAEKER